MGPFPQGDHHDGTGSCVRVVSCNGSALDFGLQCFITLELFDFALQSPHRVDVLEHAGVSDSMTGSN